MTTIDIISYKHDGDLHRVWQKVTKLYEDEKTVIIINDRADVIDGDGHKWKTREPAVCFFFKDYWFNIISMLRPDDIHYYCNLSSPYIIDQEGIKYIDYDLDIKVFPNGEVLVLDKDEYDFNIKNLHYSDEIVNIIKDNTYKLLDMIENKEVPFDKASVHRYYQEYLDIINK